jgi:cation diffusion facilitator CzcD-associated flavoprotein CzcO
LLPCTPADVRLDRAAANAGYPRSVKGGYELQADEEIEIAVIGAGAAGLAVAQALKSVGREVLVLEAAAHLGAPWRRRHEQLTLNSHRDLSTLPGVAYPAGTPAFPNRAAVVRLFEEFARRHALAIEFGTGARRIERAGARWRIDAGDRVWLARHVVVATGRDRVPVIPDWPGKEGFAGRLLHAAEFGRAADFTGMSVLVAGAGNSGFDALNHLARAGTGQMWLSARHAPALLPKRIANIAVHKISTQLAYLPAGLADAVLAGAQRLVFGDLAKLGFPKSAGGGVSRLQGKSIAIATDDGAVAAIRAGRIRVVAPVRSFAGDEARLEDGTILRPDAVIAATGYRTGLEPMVGHLGVLDASGRPRFNGGQSDPALPGLWFSGMRADIRGCFVNARLKAGEIVRAIERSR